MREQATPTRCWEYRAVYLDRPQATDDLDQLGDDGWELVSVAASYAYFKRPTNVPSSQRSPSFSHA